MLIFVGAVVVEDEVVRPYQYDDERIIILSDYYHESDVEQLTGLLQPLPRFKWIGTILKCVKIYKVIKAMIYCA